MKEKLIAMLKRLAVEGRTSVTVSEDAFRLLHGINDGMVPNFAIIPAEQDDDMFFIQVSPSDDFEIGLVEIDNEE